MNGMLSHLSDYMKERNNIDQVSGTKAINLPAVEKLIFLECFQTIRMKVGMLVTNLEQMVVWTINDPS